MRYAIQILAKSELTWRYIAANNRVEAHSIAAKVGDVKKCIKVKDASDFLKVIGGKA